LILVVAGSGVFPFVRLLGKADEIAPRFPIPFLMQDGGLAFPAHNCRTLGLVGYRLLMELYRDATLIISHTSSGPLIYAKKFGKPIITLPRRSDLGEAVDDHQVETAAALKAIADPFRITLDGPEELEAAVRAMLDALAGGLSPSAERRELESLQGSIRAACLE
jgi:UDP-N-acetylglucosamine transferase subunit ALG13